GRLTAQHHTLERFPGDGLEVRADHFQQPADDVAVVLLVPQTAQPAVRVFELFQLVEEITRAGGLRPVATTTPEVAPAVDGDGPQPGTKGAGAAGVIEARQLADEHGEHVLGEVVGVGVGQEVAAQPAADEWGVKTDQPVPGGVIRPGTQALQQADRSVRHGTPSLTCAVWRSWSPIDLTRTDRKPRAKQHIVNHWRGRSVAPVRRGGR